MAADPTIMHYSIAYTPPQFNDKTVDGANYPQTISFAQMYNTPVTALGNQSLQQVLNNPSYHDAKINSIRINLTGSHKYDCSNGTFVTLTLYDTSRNAIGPFNYSDNPGGAHSGTSNITITGSVGNPPILDHYIINFGRIRTTCATHPFENILLTFTITLQVGQCNAQSIDNPACVTYCTANQSACLSDYLTYCLNPTNPTIGTNQNCQNFFQNYISKNGPNAQIDAGLSTYCSSKYKNFADLFNGDNQVDKDLCACHMPNQLYVDFASELSQRYPSLSNLGNLGVNNRCIVPQCSSSPYPSTVSRATCALPNCLNVATFNNDGTLGPVTVNQTGNCASISGGGGTPNPTSTPTPPGPTTPPSPTTTPSSSGFINSIHDHGLIYIIVSVMLVILFATLLIVIHSPILRIIFAILLVLAFIFLLFVLYVRFLMKPPTPAV